MFQPFFTTKPPGSGSGIGLSLSRRILDRHEGHLELDQTSPHTCFKITLPGLAVMDEAS